MDSAINLISSYNFESISIRQIASGAGIKSSSIYNHYKSKEDILDTIYAYFKGHAYYSQIPIDEMKRLICVITPQEFVDKVHFRFDKEGEKIYWRMSLIMKIIYTRIFIDDMANSIFSVTLGRDSILYSKEILDYGISIGRVEPLDTYLFSSCLNGQLHMMGIRAFTDPEHTASTVPDEPKIQELYASMLKFNSI